MRVEIAESIPEQAGGIAIASTDPAARRALQNFAGMIGAADSLFSSEQRGTVPAAGESARGRTCAGDFVLSFRSAKLARDRKLHFLLVEKLIELLKGAGSAEFLLAKVCLFSPGSKAATRAGCAVWLSLEATGDSHEQAGLRWSLGLAHLQQALLFTSRYLRQQISKLRT
jgi:hypothetical protein